MLRQTPIAYYIADSGIGQVLRYYGRQDRLRVGVVGQGAGALAVYLSGPGQTRCASTKSIPRCRGWPKNYFTYLADARSAGRRSNWCWAMRG